MKDPRKQAFAHQMLSLGYGELGNDAQAMQEAQNFLTFARKTLTTFESRFNFPDRINTVKHQQRPKIFSRANGRRRF